MTLRRSTRLSNKRSSDNELAAPESKKPRLSPEISDAINDADEHDGNSSAPETTAEAVAEQQAFRLMDLPAEIRVQIYFACLTRPYEILLSKEPDELEAATTVYAPSLSDTRRVLSANDQAAAMLRRRRHARLLQQMTQTQGAPRLFQRGMPTMLQNVPQAQGVQRRTRGAVRLAAQPPLVVQTSIIVKRERKPRPEHLDRLLVNLMAVSKLIYKEARPVLYGENVFLLDVNTALASLAALHQRSRGQIRLLRLDLPSHADITDKFSTIVRLALRYCWRLQSVTIIMPKSPPSANITGSTINTTNHASTFDILRWLPQRCKVVLEGTVTDEIRTVVNRNAALAETLDEVQFPGMIWRYSSLLDLQLAYARRQLMADPSYDCSTVAP